MKCVGLMILFLHWSLSDAQRFVLKGPDDVVAALGSDIILSCSLDPRESAVNMEVTWSRSDLNNRVVHHYKDQQDMNSEQDPSYRQRTSLFKDELQNGNTSLLLKDVQMSDEGKYKCEVQDGGAYDYLMITVTVTGIGTIPEITLLGVDVSSGVHLLCETKGWKSEPDLEWVDSEGRELPVGDTEKHKDKELYTVRHTITVSQSGTKTFICRVKQHPRMNTEITLKLGQFSNPWKISDIIQIIVIIILSLAVVILCFKYRGLKMHVNQMNDF